MKQIDLAPRRPGARAALILGFVLLLAIAMGTLPGRAAAASDPQDSLIYMPYGLIHSIHSIEQVDGYLAEVDDYGIGQFVFAMPKFKAGGTLKLPRHNREMLLRFAEQASLYDARHGSSLSLTAVYNGKTGTRGHELNLEQASTRANIVAAVEGTLDDGLSGVQLDLEPYPQGPGFQSLLDELDAVFARVGFSGRFSVTAPASISRWSPAYLHRVSELVTQVDPLYYDSESKTIAAYQSWMKASLSYSADPWHLPSVENITAATEALAAGLSAGDRVNGAGIWSGWGFLMDEEGKYDGSADRATWLSTTTQLAFSP
jgi:hypothetical protein